MTNVLGPCTTALQGKGKGKGSYPNNLLETKGTLCGTLYGRCNKCADGTIAFCHKNGFCTNNADVVFPSHGSLEYQNGKYSSDAELDNNMCTTNHLQICGRPNQNSYTTFRERPSHMPDAVYTPIPAKWVDT